MEEEYTDEDFEITETLLQYWFLGLVSQQSVSYNEATQEVEILWHSA